MTPLARLIDEVVRCVTCGQCIGDCECHDDDPQTHPRLKSRKWKEGQKT